MTMVTDPVCGMRIDTDDAVATAQFEGTTYYFCSQACHDAFVADRAAEPAADTERLTETELADQAFTTPERIAHLVDLGILSSDDGTFSRQDVMRVRVVGQLEAARIEVGALARGLASGHLTLGYLEAAGRVQPRSHLTFEEIAAQTGIPFADIERLYLAFGLPRPTFDERVRAEDMEALMGIRVLFEAGLDSDDVIRLARLWGDNVRRMAQYLPHHFHSTVEERFRQQGLGDNQAYEAAIIDVGLRVGRSGEDLLGWLFRRHSEVFATEHQFQHVETALELAGVRPRPRRALEAAVFADISGFTELTERSGDEAAAGVALTLGEVATETASRHRGEVVKLLGDGVLLHFEDPADAVRASLDIVDTVPTLGLPPAHVGVEAGPMLYEEGDYFGRTVNLAARIANQAGPGQVLVGESVADNVTDDRLQFLEVGTFPLKGITGEVRILQAVPTS